MVGTKNKSFFQRLIVQVGDGEKNKKIRLLILMSVFFLGVFLRGFRYQYYPLTGHLEEYLYAWSGLSLIEKGVPISWNDLPPYPKWSIIFNGVIDKPQISGKAYVRLLRPWLDEPPLYSLTVGLFAKLYGLENFTILSPMVIRLPALFFSFITMLLLFFIGRKLLGFWTAVLGLLFYSVTPTIVFANRLSVAENMVTPLFLAVMYFVLQYLDTGQKWQRNLAVLLAGVAALAKPPGWLIVAFAAFVVFQKRKSVKEALWMFFVGSLIFWLPFIAYGAYYNWDLFIKVIGYQAKRPVGWSSLAFILTHPGFSIDVLLDGWIILGFLALVFLMFKKKSEPENLLLLMFIFSIFMVIYSGGKHDQLGWYRYPVYPFLALTTALMFRTILRSPNFANSFIFILLTMSQVDLLENPFWKWNFLVGATPFRVLLLLMLLPSGSMLVWPHIRLRIVARFIILLTLFLGIIISIWVVITRFNKLCDNTLCPLPAKVNLLRPKLW